METLKFGYKFFKKDMPMAVFAEILSFVGIYAELLLPYLTAILVDFVIRSGTVKEDSGGFFHFLLTGKYGEVHTMQLFGSVAVVYIILLLVRIVLIYIRDLMQERVGVRMEASMRYATYDKLMELDTGTITDYNSGELLQILNSDTVMFKALFAFRMAWIGDFIFALIVLLILIARINILFFIMPALLMPLLIMKVLDFRKKAKVNFQNIRKKSSEMNLSTQENIAAVRIVRSFTNEELEKKKFGAANTNFLDARLKQIWLASKFDLTFNTLKQIAYISTIVIGGILAIKGYMTVGSILAASTYVTRFMQYVTGLNTHLFTMQQETIAGLELKKFLERESQVPDSEVPNIRCDAPNIELKDVSLTLDGQEILKNITLSIPYGKKLGIVGETGSGKSVLLKTLVRTRDITSGQITIDGYDIKDFSLKKLRNLYSYVFQDVFLFSNTIESNISFNKQDVDFRLVSNAAAHAQASKFIEELPDRYKTIVGERGLGISGGQKQRVSIARAFHKNAPVFVLDDSTSALDVNTERVLLKDIWENFAEKTVIITAHRFSSVVTCDEIIYMKDGVITERGTFEELMALGGSFAHVYNVQQEQQAQMLTEKTPKEVESNG